MSYAYGRSEEEFSGDGCNSELEAIVLGIRELGLEVGDCVYTGVAVRPTIASMADSADRVIDGLRDYAADNYGDYSESWLECVSSEAERDLDASFKRVLTEWADRHGMQPSFFAVENVESHEVTQELYDEANK